MISINKAIRIYQGLLLSIGLIIIAIGGTLFGIIPGVKSSLSMFEEMQTLGKEVEQLKRKNEILESFDLEILRQELSVALSAVPGDKSLPTLFTTIEGLTQQTNTTLTAMNLSSPGSISTVSAKIVSAEERLIGSGLLPISITIDGQLDNLKNFLTTSTTVRRLLRIRKVDILFLNETTARASLSVDAFYLPLPQLIGKASDAISPMTPNEEELIARLGNFPLLVPPIIGSNTTLPQEPKSDPFFP